MYVSTSCRAWGSGLTNSLFKACTFSPKPSTFITITSMVPHLPGGCIVFCLLPNRLGHCSCINNFCEPLHSEDVVRRYKFIPKAQSFQGSLMYMESCNHCTVRMLIHTFGNVLFTVHRFFCFSRYIGYVTPKMICLYFTK